jgi:hypothetical protein
VLLVQADLDYLDENADRLARKKMKTDASKRLYAINGTAHPLSSHLLAVLSLLDSISLRACH